jgi:hypothetical protein
MVLDGVGHFDWLNFGTAGQVREVMLTGASGRQSGTEHIVSAALRRNGLTARLADGRALARVEIRWPAPDLQRDPSQPTKARIEFVIRDDFMRVRHAIDYLLNTQPTLFDNTALVRTRLLSALWSALGASERNWCCADDVGLPLATTDPARPDPSTLERPELQPFLRYCATCHLTHERFPPNFLFGDAQRVVNNLQQCASRILVRISAWRTLPHERTKSPMPPVTAVQALGSTDRFAHGKALEAMRSYIEELSRNLGQPTDLTTLLKDGYEALPRCLPH